MRGSGKPFLGHAQVEYFIRLSQNGVLTFGNDRNLCKIELVSGGRHLLKVSGNFYF